MTSYFVGVDVGTRSARAALVDKEGQIVHSHCETLEVFNPIPDFYEQSSTQIWEKACKCIHMVTRNISQKDSIKGIGFDATCSLVVLDQKFQPLSVSLKQDTQNNVIMWMDHRAKTETEYINSTPRRVLEALGGKMSMEMQIPKLLWLKENLPGTWASAGHFFDLPDFLTFKATGKTTRSLCSLVCKWTYQYDETSGSWDDNFLRQIGLGDLVEDNHQKIGQLAQCPGSLCGGLSYDAAWSMGLLPGTAVGTSLIDAHAGGLALLASKSENCAKPEFTGKLGLICGTSTCHMCLSIISIPIPGVWGPFYSAILPDFWLTEGGQSATGSLVDHIIKGHPAYAQCPAGQDYYTWLEEHLLTNMAAKELTNVSFYTKDLHVYPDFHGNRSPLADSSFRGMICGLTLDDSVDSLAILYLATLQAVTYGTKDIVEKMISNGCWIKTILMCGGLSKSKLFVQLHADILGLPVLIPKTRESVLIGAAMLGACASASLGTESLEDVASQMGSEADMVEPDSSTERFHSKKFEVFKKLQNDWIAYRKIMST